MNPAFNLFILDDEPSERQLLALLVRKYFPDWNLAIAATGEQLLQQLARTTHTPLQASLVLVDMLLAGSDGVSVLQQVHALDGLGTLPVVGFSNYSSRVDIEGFLNQGAKAFFNKAHTIDHMLELLARLPSLAAAE